MSEFQLPSLGADMESATLREWFVNPGDRVKKGDIVAAVETDKGIIDIEIFEAGTVEKILVQPDEKVPVGTVLATYRGEGEPEEKIEKEKVKKEIAAERGKPAAPEPAATAPAVAIPEAKERKRISPAARKRARELGIDPEKIHGTGSGGAVTLEDVISSAGPAALVETAVKGEEKAETGMRRAIAAAMARSKKEIPHYYLSTSIDLTPALSWLALRNAERPLPQRMVYAVLLLKAVARALEKVPEMNGFFVDDQAQVHSEVHIGVAISLRRGGLLVPGLRDVHKKDLDSLMPDFADLVSRARVGHLRSSELQDATITVTSLGEQGVEMVFPIIYPPQLAIVGFGSVVERVWPVDGKPQIRRIINASLGADHRASDGHRGALFLAEIDRLLQEPQKL
ncbi:MULTISPECIES: dihydrolipoamide acetyltransferase family protein [unclassified Microbulbifer]|uniref:dihydrolipoamide acetyltransferase family protein n=1 Tax=unclassified Microbulbifer TaxID=2619833 RepID=UPI0027E418C0|nr:MULTISPECIES: dihydrolipoamide acetyltransferase family protein [unclassified Microbulbifer]